MREGRTGEFLASPAHPTSEVTLSDRPIRVLVTVDTEEDNWWPTRVDVTARNVGELPRLHEVLDAHGVRPTYLVTYRVARDEAAVRTLIRLRDRSGVEIGAHLHPWNTPPQRLEVAECVSLSDVPVGVQREMVRSLTGTIEETTGVRPRSFRAGRWSLPPSLVPILADAGYVADSSVLPYIHWHDVPGSSPDHRAPLRPYRLGTGEDLDVPDPEGAVVEVPATSGYNRTPWPWVSRFDRLVRARGLRALHLHGILHRTGLVRRITLTPEQFGARDMLRLSEAAFRQGVSVLNLHFHSSSLLPGCNEYVRTARDREVLLGRLSRYFEGLDERWSWRSATLSEVAAASTPARGGKGRDGWGLASLV